MNPATDAPRKPQRSNRRELKQGKTKKMTKDDKICHLKSDLKIAKEENARLRKEIERVRNNNNNNNRQNGTKSGHNDKGVTPSDEQRKKFREAMRALKKVTVNQESVIRTMRKKADQRRNELKQRDAYIGKLEQQVKTLKATESLLKQLGSGDQDLKDKVKELQSSYDEAIRKKNDLEEILDEKEAQMEAMQKQRKSLLNPNGFQRQTTNGGNLSDGGSVGSGSLQSVSTAGDFEVARLKTELAKKSDKVVKLEMDLEMVRDELHELKIKSRGPDAFGGGAFFQNAFAGQSGDDWTDADETDYDESEFGECFFRKGEDNVDFW